MPRGDRVLPHGSPGEGLLLPRHSPGLSELPPLQPRPWVWDPPGSQLPPRMGTHWWPPRSRGDGRDLERRGWRRVALVAGGPGGRAGRDSGHPQPAPPGTSGPDSTSQPSLIIPNPHPGRRVNKACLVFPRPSSPSPGPLTYSNSFHTGAIPSLEGHLQELSRVGRGRGADPRQEAKASRNLHICALRDVK